MAPIRPALSPFGPATPQFAPNSANVPNRATAPNRASAVPPAGKFPSGPVVDGRRRMGASGAQMVLGAPNAYTGQPILRVLPPENPSPMIGQAAFAPASATFSPANVISQGNPPSEAQLSWPGQPPPSVVAQPPTVAPPLFGSIVRSFAKRRRSSGWSDVFWGRTDPNLDVGLGELHVVHAMSEIETAAPVQRIGFRSEFVDDFAFPDQAEMLWAKIGGRGPVAAETAVSYQKLSFMTEVGGANMSLRTEVPLIAVNPVVNPNHASIGDMSLHTKLVLVQNSCWMISQYTRTVLPTGSPRNGLGTGHTSMEPGILVRYNWNPLTTLHQEIRYFVPIAGDPTHSGQVFRYGLGFSHVWYDSPTMSVLTSLEYVNWSVQNGLRTTPQGLTQPVDGNFTHAIFPTLKIIKLRGSKRFEVGITSGLRIQGDSLFDRMLRVDLTIFTY